MNIFYLIYLLLSSIIIAFVAPFILICVFLTGRYKRLICERLGFYSKNLSSTKKYHVWLHAVSVGEVNVARSIINSLFDDHDDLDIILSTTTPKGFEIANKIVHPHLKCIYSPIDFIASVRLAFHKIKPDVLVLLETEIWPNWIFTANTLKIPVAIVNGRISQKTVSGYKKFPSLISYILNKIDIFSMISLDDAKRISKIGAPSEKIVVSGNAKFDLLNNAFTSQLPIKLRTLLNINKNDFVFVAGSTRTGEEEMVLFAYKSLLKQFPNAICIIAPRHIERTPAIASILKKHNLNYDLYSKCKNLKKRKEQIILVDTIGDLSGLYSISTVVFCGASLVPQGGQNVLEPAIWEKPVIYGPHMDDFLWAKEVLESESGGVMVNNESELFEKIQFFANNKDQADKIGKNARNAVSKKAGASRKHANIITNILQNRAVNQKSKCGT